MRTRKRDVCRSILDTCKVHVIWQQVVLGYRDTCSPGLYVYTRYVCTNPFSRLFGKWCMFIQKLQFNMTTDMPVVSATFQDGTFWITACFVYVSGELVLFADSTKRLSSSDRRHWMLKLDTSGTFPNHTWRRWSWEWGGEGGDEGKLARAPDHSPGYLLVVGEAEIQAIHRPALCIVEA